MPHCCAQKPLSDGMNKTFSRSARWYAWKFRWHGLEKVQRLLLEGVRTESIAGKEVLDIGCGIGGLYLTLLKKDGAARATGVDAAEGMIAEARSLSAELGTTERTSYHVRDFVDMSDTIRETDITLLDKVVCCYGDLESLVQLSTSKTKGIYALSHPRERLLVKLVYKFQIAIAETFGGTFRTFWHDWVGLKERIQSLGFQIVYANKTIFWQVLVFKRTAGRRKT
jgi:2-polyprenyl-3-methyl-5-hydroxy-6-metoxy-1,4-benzoquinol methylase